MASGRQRYERAILIYNPRAGKLNRKGSRLLQRIIETIRAGGHEVQAVPTTGPRTAAAIARTAVAAGADLVLAAGGDGTLNEVLDGVVGTPVPLGIIPLGTANVLAAELRVRGGALGAAAELALMVPRRVATGVLRNDLNPEGRHFLLMAGAGLDAQIVYQVNAPLKDRLGKGAYWLAGFGQVGRRLPLLEVRIEGRTSPCSFALASRVKNYGGDLTIARNASLLSNEFEVVLFHGQQSWLYLRYFLGVLARRLDKMKGVTVTQAHTLELACPTDPRIYIQVDGEYAGRLPASLAVVPDAVTLLVPAGFLPTNG